MKDIGTYHVRLKGGRRKRLKQRGVLERTEVVKQRLTRRERERERRRAVESSWRWLHEEIGRERETEGNCGISQCRDTKGD